MQLVGRDVERAAAIGQLDAVASDGGRFLLIEGEPGIGKTSLLDAVVGVAEERGWLVLEGRGAELERETPFGIVVAAMDDYLSAIVDDLDRRVEPATTAELAAIFPALRRLAGDRAAAGPEDRLLAYRATATLLGQLATSGPVVVVLDDLHWADLATRELLGHLLRHPPRGPVLIAGAFRPRQVDPVLREEVAAAVREGEAMSIALEPLDREAADRLMAPVTAGRERDRLFAESGGNPFFLQQLVHHTAADQDLVTDDAGLSAEVPAGVRRSIAAEIARLAPSARLLIEGASVAGDPFELDLAAAAVGLDEDEALVALDDLAGLDLVRPGVTPRHFHFRHPLVRSGVYDGVAPGRRLRAHAACAEVLTARGSEPPLLAHHVERSAKHGDVRAVATLAAAARLAGGRAPASAARWLGQAVRLLPAEAGPEQRLALLLPLPGLLTAVGDLEGAHTAVLDALALVPGPASGAWVQLTVGAAALEQALGRHEASAERLSTAIAGLGEGDERVGLYVSATTAAVFRRRVDELPEWVARTSTAGREVEDLPLRCAALAVAALASTLADDVARARVLRDEVAPLIDGLADDDLVARPDGVAFLAAAELYLDLFEPSVEHANRAFLLARRSGQTALAPALIPALGSSLRMLGRTDESVALFDEAVETARTTRQPQLLAMGLFSLALAQQSAGRLEEAERNAAEALDRAREAGDEFVMALAGMTAGSIRLEQGDAPAALELLVATTGELAERVLGHQQLFALEKIVTARLEVDRAGAEPLAAEAQRVAAAFGTPMADAWAERTAARVRLANGDHQAAAELARAAAAHAASVGARPEVAIAEVVEGMALERAGDRDGAVEVLARAAATFEACGTPRWRDGAERELGRLGHRTHRRTTPAAASGPGAGVAALTGRELDVARLVVDRRTNAEIADTLFLSIKTVESHLRNIFRKLDVTSRAEVARHVEAAEA